MLSEREIDDLLAEVESSGRVVEVDSVSPDGHQLSVADADALVTGDVLPGGVAESGRSLVVAGSACGQAGSPCRLKAGRTLLVRGDLAQAQAAAPSLRLGAQVSDAQVNARDRIRIGGDLAASRLVLGDFRAEELRLRALKHEVENQTEAHENLRSQVKFACRKILKESHGTQPGFQLGLGNILLERQRTIAVNLAPLYRLLEERGVHDRHDAVSEFFDRVVVGSLTKANKHYIAKNRGRQEVFLKLLKELRQLFDMVCQLDAMDAGVQAAEGEAAGILERLRQPGDLRVEVSGQVGVGVEIEFVGARVNDDDGGEPKIERVSARLRVRPGEDEAHLALELADFDAQAATQVVPVEELHGVACVLADGQVALEPLAVEVEAEASRAVA